MVKGQSKLASIWEAISNTVIGFVVNIVSSPIIYHAVGIAYVTSQLWLATAYFTLVSIVRGYVVRRFFNKSEAKKDKQLELEIKRLRDFISQQGNVFLSELYDSLTLIHGYREENIALKEQIETLKFQQSAGTSDVADVNWNTSHGKSSHN